ncbi:MAG: hypothetical protein JXM72_11880 [Deltaproteobacteria bacterium]|nr:hypothetical protein [Deltaproteobacteria bacterium]
MGAASAAIYLQPVEMVSRLKSLPQNKPCTVMKDHKMIQLQNAGSMLQPWISMKPSKIRNGNVAALEIKKKWKYH